MKTKNIKTSLVTLAVLLVVVSATFGDTIYIDVDATELPRKLLHSQIKLDLSGDKVSLLYPKWIPGLHGPLGPVQNLARFTVTDARGKTVRWQRDWEDIYRFFVFTEGATNPCKVSLTFICNQSSTLHPATYGYPSLGVIEWNSVVVYPEGIPIQDITVQLSLKLPKGWKYGSALPMDRHDGDTVIFKPVTFEELVDMPLICGENFRTVEIASTSMAKYFLHIAADDIASLPDDDSVFVLFKSLANEAEALFTRTHFHTYHWLLVLSDSIPVFGLERRNSSLNCIKASGLREPEIGKLMPPDLIPHEFFHAWCGKYRRPAGMLTPDYMKPKKMDLLWVYEGLTTYYGVVLATRSGFMEAQDSKDILAIDNGMLIHTKGRQWRPLRDTEVSTYTLWQSSESWSFLRRGPDYYPEGAMIWLEFDARIRKATNGEKSLDDFCAAFFSRGDPTASAVSFDLDEVISTLNNLTEQSWESLIKTKLNQTQDEYEPEALRLCGYRLDYTDKKSKVQESMEETRDKFLNLYDSIGLSVNEEGKIGDVVPEGPADEAGLYAGVEIIGVNGKKYSYERLEDAIRNTPSESKIRLLTLQHNTFRETAIEYDDGLRYYTLTPIEGKHDYLSDILTPKVTVK